MGDTIVDISRDFLDEAGAKRYQDIHVELPDFDKAPFNPEAKENIEVASSPEVTEIKKKSTKKVENIKNNGQPKEKHRLHPQ